MNSPADNPSLERYWNKEFAAGGPPPTWYLCQPLGGLVAFSMGRWGIHPLSVTLAGFGLACAGAAVFALAPVHGLAAVLSSLLLILAYVFDCADGQLARATQQSSERGKWLDVYCDVGVVVLLPAAALWLYADASLLVRQGLLLCSAVLICGRLQDLLTATMFRSEHKSGFQTQGWSHLGRKLAVTFTDTFTLSLLAGLLRHQPWALMVLFAGVGGLGFAHSCYVGMRRFSL